MPTTLDRDEITTSINGVDLTDLVSADQFHAYFEAHYPTSADAQWWAEKSAELEADASDREYDRQAEDARHAELVCLGCIL